MSSAEKLFAEPTAAPSTGAPGADLPDALFDALRVAVGAEHVSTGDEQLAAYSRCTIPWDARCSAVVFPGSTHEVVQVLRAASEFRVPVWPYSGGRNWGYGATLAPEAGAIVMVLRRMNRIVEVNDELAYAVIEPGVSYRQLSEHLRAQGHALWADCIDGTPEGSVIGNALDRGIGETPYGDHFGNLCGLEVVLPTGEIITTGGGTADLRTRHVHKWGVGPYFEGIFSQSNLGVVTRAGIWLMPQPECFNSFVFELHDEQHFAAVVDAFRRLALDGVLSSKLHMINDFVSTTVLTQRNLENVPQDGPMSADDRARIRRKYRVALWSCAGGLYGPKAHVALQKRALKAQLGRFGRLLFVSDRKVALLELLVAAAWQRPRLRSAAEIALGASLPVMDSLPHVHRILKGIPTDYFLKHAYYRSRRSRPAQDVEPARDRCGLIWFAPVLPNVGSEIQNYIATSELRFQEMGFDFYVAMLMMNPRAVVCLMNINFDRDSAGEEQRALDLYHVLLDDMRRQGYEQYRAALLGWEELAAGSAVNLQLHGRIKAALDPAGILAPGRYGVV